jgi:penicillin-binding protein 1C
LALFNQCTANNKEALFIPYSSITFSKKTMREKLFWWKEQWRWKKRFIKRICFFLFLIWYIQALPSTLFNDSYSTVLVGKNGKLLGAHIAKDGQWRFPPSGKTPSKIAVCLVTFEDKNFHHHLGVSLLGIGRAFYQNIAQGKIVSGGSTITQQVIRLMRKNPSRTYSEKIYEIILATRLEFSYSKKEILNLYTANAPFGNNVVGIDAASWRYFGRAPEHLSWAESATLAVLPNAPGLIYPGKNHQSLLKKRNRLLKMLYHQGKIDKLNYFLALEEPLPDKPLPLPQEAPHLLQRCILHGQKEQLIQSTLDEQIQAMVNHEAEQYALRMNEYGIFNAAVLITSVETGEVLAYKGNLNHTDEEHAFDVDCVQAPRSTGSILKPLLYAKSLESGLITPKQLLCDFPSRFGTFAPNNFNRQFSGALPANKALSKSLNIPMVYLLREYGQAKFHNDLKLLGFRHMNKRSSHYGLSLILGGAEANLWEVNACYNSLAQHLQSESTTTIHFSSKLENGAKPLLNKAAIFSTFEALVDVNRPDEENNWRAFESSQKISWKTGTSFGFRDAWAVGITPKYVVSVWVGNADGEGRPGLTGVKAAAPLLFSIFRNLDAPKKWFQKPLTEMTRTEICTKSGQISNRFCENTHFEYIPSSSLISKNCSYHQLVHLNQTETFRVNADCENSNNMKHKSWFILPPSMEKYYVQQNPSYQIVPPFDPKCSSNKPENIMSFIYPKHQTKIYIPRELNGQRGKVIFEIAHTRHSSILYWHIDEAFIGSTSEIHQIAVQPERGKHHVTVVDETGVILTEAFEVL